MSKFYLFSGDEYYLGSKQDWNRTAFGLGTFMYNPWSQTWAELQQIPTNTYSGWYYVAVDKVPAEYKLKLLLLT